GPGRRLEAAMRIGIDVRYLSHGLIGGVHTYVEHFVPALTRLASDDQIFLYADTKRPFELRELPPNVVLRCLPWRGRLSSLYLDLFLRREMARDRLDVVHYPANYGFGPPGARTVITLHDTINVLPLREIVRGHPKRPRTVAMMAYLHCCTRLSLRRADLLLTVSAHAAGLIAQQTGFDRARIVAVPHAPTPDLRRVTDPAVLGDLRQRHRLDGAFVLADALKNPAAVVGAWRRLPEALRRGRRIVFFARRPDLLPIVHQAVAADQASLLLRPSRADLIALYSLADAFVFPSWMEGFGIPVIEAMTCGAPVVASDRGSIPEVAGGAALLADADDAAGLARHLAAVLGDPSLAARLRALGHARAAEFSWNSTAARILESYQQAAAA
ncbi:MAG TPA: glycosyltransferase family 1 protein, partial [Chloroflexota bacterium]